MNCSNTLENGKSLKQQPQFYRKKFRANGVSGYTLSVQKSDKNITPKLPKHKPPQYNLKAGKNILTIKSNELTTLGDKQQIFRSEK